MKKIIVIAVVLSVLGSFAAMEILEGTSKKQL